LASFASRASTPNADDRSAASRRPFRLTVFAFFIMPLSGSIAPGVPTPITRRTPEARVLLQSLHDRDHPPDDVVVPPCTLRRDSRAPRRSVRMPGIDNDRFDLRASEVDSPEPLA
jgi:hypothetical protein